MELPGAKNEIKEENGKAYTMGFNDGFNSAIMAVMATMQTFLDKGGAYNVKGQ